MKSIKKMVLAYSGEFDTSAMEHADVDKWSLTRVQVAVEAKNQPEVKKN